jgi:hypothetical protein
VQKGYKEDIWGNQVSSVREAVKKRDSWKGEAIQKGLEHGSRRLAIVRSRYQGTAGKDTRLESLARAAVICKVWRLAMAL